MRHAAALLVVVGLLATTGARADVTGSWRVGFSNFPGGPLVDFCRFDLVEHPGGEIEGWLGLCGLGTDGVFSGSVDAGGAVALRIVAPDDVGCETYQIAATLNGTMDQIVGSYICTYPITLSGDVVLTRCDPLTPGSCPQGPGVGLPPRVHEIRACAPTPAACDGSSGARATVKLQRDDTFHWKVSFKLPDAAGTTLSDLGDPTTVRDYVACIYQTVGGSPSLIGMEPAWANTSCGDSPCWTTSSNSVKYRNRTGRLGKLQKIQAKVKSSGLMKVFAKGDATTVLAQPPGATLGLPVTVQLLADDACVGATFTAATMNVPDRFKAVNGQ